MSREQHISEFIDNFFNSLMETYPEVFKNYASRLDDVKDYYIKSGKTNEEVMEELQTQALKLISRFLNRNLKEKALKNKYFDFKEQDDPFLKQVSESIIDNLGDSEIPTLDFNYDLAPNVNEDVVKKTVLEFYKYLSPEDPSFEEKVNNILSNKLVIHNTGGRANTDPNGIINLYFTGKFNNLVTLVHEVAHSLSKELSNSTTEIETGLIEDQFIDYLIKTKLPFIQDKDSPRALTEMDRLTFDLIHEREVLDIAKRVVDEFRFKKLYFEHGEEIDLDFLREFAKNPNSIMSIIDGSKKIKDIIGYYLSNDPNFDYSIYNTTDNKFDPATGKQLSNERWFIYSGIFREYFKQNPNIDNIISFMSSPKFKDHNFDFQQMASIFNFDFQNPQKLIEVFNNGYETDKKEYCDYWQKYLNIQAKGYLQIIANEFGGYMPQEKQQLLTKLLSSDCVVFESDPQKYLLYQQKAILEDSNLSDIQKRQAISDLKVPLAHGGRTFEDGLIHFYPMLQEKSKEGLMNHFNGVLLHELVHYFVQPTNSFFDGMDKYTSDRLNSFMTEGEVDTVTRYLNGKYGICKNYSSEYGANVLLTKEVINNQPENMGILFAPTSQENLLVESGVSLGKVIEYQKGLTPFQQTARKVSDIVSLGASSVSDSYYRNIINNAANEENKDTALDTAVKVTEQKLPEKAPDVSKKVNDYKAEQQLSEKKGEVRKLTKTNPNSSGEAPASSGGSSSGSINIIVLSLITCLVEIITFLIVYNLIK